MNKYQEALDFLCDHAMEYQEDYDYDENECGDYVLIGDVDEYRNPLQELVDKATPKEPTRDYVVDGYYYRCPICGNLILEESMIMGVDANLLKNNNSYCPRCGQRIDWSDE